MTTRTQNPLPQRSRKNDLVFTKVEISSLDTEDRNCPICWEPFREGESAIRTSCKHVFGSECLQTWLCDENTCPQCRRPIFDESDEAEFDDMIDRVLDSPTEAWPNDRARMIFLLENKRWVFSRAISPISGFRFQELRYSRKTCCGSVLRRRHILHVTP